MSIRPVLHETDILPIPPREGGRRSEAPSVSAGGQSAVLTVSPVDMSERVLASLSRVGNEPGVVTVYTEPLAGAVLTDVRVRLTDGSDGTRTIRDQYGPSVALPRPASEGVASLGSYEDSARVANDMDLYFQGMKINRRV
ncbi:hypothetical protein [Leptospirillum ferriphilum]|jgi:hypothetical protein|uniref:Uncharacterized protein n=3 Tax=Leptospirillum ferriphilum TaxID=178606 RepID=A0A059Y394_9BACT|nr:hypothetical protein [Leptospirillum ferriphilum]EAY58247.1 MAG: protein of unknown function [Leptospirillum rubarum]AFS54476.1 hypothetical protein LFML04_2286 [Leptospirillum ferriphilum ML-04]AIA32002.1 hypothetical protein Y981_11875 [Leptospirillum ferriphilum YSK]OOH71444.1 hypothetical protein BOX24_07935 [Leptospirillum ferriphilum]OOH82253.1 hypothetical protein BOX30_03780 [Leptospirillum ferriphilum]